MSSVAWCVTWCACAGDISGMLRKGSCWCELDDCARCTLGSSSQLSQQGRERAPCGLNLTAHRHVREETGSGSCDCALNSVVTHWEVGCRCRLWGRSRRCACGNGSGTSAARLWALASARRWSSSVMNDRNKPSFFPTA